MANMETVIFTGSTMKRRWIFSTDNGMERWAGGPYVVIANPIYFNAIRQDVLDWCDSNLSKYRFSGLMIIFTSSDEMALFKLAWG